MVCQSLKQAYVSGARLNDHDRRRREHCRVFIEYDTRWGKNNSIRLLSCCCRGILLLAATLVYVDEKIARAAAFRKVVALENGVRGYHAASSELLDLALSPSAQANVDGQAERDNSYVERYRSPPGDRSMMKTLGAPVRGGGCLLVS